MFNDVVAFPVLCHLLIRKLAAVFIQINYYFAVCLYQINTSAHASYSKAEFTILVLHLARIDVLFFFRCCIACIFFHIRSQNMFFYV